MSLLRQRKNVVIGMGQMYNPPEVYPGRADLYNFPDVYDLNPCYLGSIRLWVWACFGFRVGVEDSQSCFHECLLGKLISSCDILIT